MQQEDIHRDKPKQEIFMTQQTQSSSQDSQPQDNQFESQNIQSNSNPQQFILNHNSQRRVLFKCPHTNCNKSYTRVNRLDSHIKSHHEKQQLYQCPFQGCAKSFSEKGNLKVHMRVHSGEKPYECEICLERFSTVGNFKDHVRRHLNIKPYQCRLCGHFYYRKYQVIKHLKSKHQQFDIESNIIRMPNPDLDTYKQFINEYREKTQKPNRKDSDMTQIIDSPMNDDVSIFESQNLSSLATQPQTPIVQPIVMNNRNNNKKNNQTNIQNKNDLDCASKNKSNLQIKDFQQFQEISYEQIQNLLSSSNDNQNYDQMQRFLPQSQFKLNKEVINSKYSQIESKQSKQQQNYNQNLYTFQSNLNQCFQQDSSVNRYQNQKSQQQIAPQNKSNDVIKQQRPIQQAFLEKPSSSFLNHFWIDKSSRDGPNLNETLYNHSDLNLKWLNNNNQAYPMFQPQEHAQIKQKDMNSDKNISEQYSKKLIDQLMETDQNIQPASYSNLQRRQEFISQDTSPTRFLQIPKCQLKREESKEKCQLTLQVFQLAEEQQQQDINSDKLNFSCKADQYLSRWFSILDKNENE